MRVLLLENKELNSYLVSEILDIGFDDDITNIKYSNGTCPFGKTPVFGLYFMDQNNDYYYIPGITKEQCNEICRTAMKQGFVNLTEFGEYFSENHFFPDEDD